MRFEQTHSRSKRSTSAGFTPSSGYPNPKPRAALSFLMSRNFLKPSDRLEPSTPPYQRSQRVWLVLPFLPSIDLPLIATRLQPQGSIRLRVQGTDAVRG